MKNLLKLTCGLAVAGVFFISNITTANENNETVTLEEISIANEDISEEFGPKGWWVLVSSDYVLGGSGGAN